MVKATLNPSPDRQVGVKRKPVRRFPAEPLTLADVEALPSATEANAGRRHVDLRVADKANEARVAAMFLPEELPRVRLDH